MNNQKSFNNAVKLSGYLSSAVLFPVFSLYLYGLRSRSAKALL